MIAGTPVTPGRFPLLVTNRQAESDSKGEHVPKVTALLAPSLNGGVSGSRTVNL